MNRIFIAGCGYVGHALIDQLPAGTAIGVLTHSAEHATRLRSQGVATVIGDLGHGEPLPDLSMVADRVLYYFVPPPADGITDPRLQRFLDALPTATPPLRVVLISATGVYGDCAGAWVDESREPAPESDRGRRRLHAEQTLRAWGHAQAVPIAILRVAGIYGPGRLPRKRLEQGAPVLREQDAPYSNRIHIDDLVRACIAAGTRELPGVVCNVCDGHPTTMTDYFNQVADLLDLPRPPTIGLAAAGEQMSTGMLSYLRESRRLDNRRMRELLGVEPIYPDLASGLAACRAAPA